MVGDNGDGNLPTNFEVKRRTKKQPIRLAGPGPHLRLAVYVEHIGHDDERFECGVSEEESQETCQ